MFVFMRRSCVVLMAFFLLGAPHASQAGSVSVVPAEGSPSNITWPDEDLKVQFVRYWTLYRDGEAEKLYEMEAPHFRFLVDERRYRNYVNVVTQGGINFVQVMEPIARSPYLMVIPMWLVRPGSDGAPMKVGLRDRWIRLGDSWYHVIKDPLAFPETQGS